MRTASWPARPPLPPSRLEPCIALALLLHIWLVLVLGSAPGGSARPGDGVWGRVGGVIDVRLNGLLGGDTAPSSQALPPPAPAPTPTGPVGSAKQARFGGAVRAPTSEMTEAPTSPGAARIGRWNAQAGDVAADTPPHRVTALPTEALRPAALPLAGAASLALQPIPAAPPAPAPAPVPVPAPAPSVERLPEPVAAPVAPPVAATAPAAEVPVPRVEATPVPAPPPAPSPVAQAPTPTPTPAAATSAATPSASLATAPAPAGSPDAGSRLGRDVATPASTPPTAARAPLNLSLPRGAAVSRMGGSGLFELMPHPPERKSKLEESVDAAAKADCRKAYGSAGLLAAVPLLIDAARDKGCRW